MCSASWQSNAEAGADANSLHTYDQEINELLAGHKLQNEIDSNQAALHGQVEENNDQNHQIGVVIDLALSNLSHQSPCPSISTTDETASFQESVSENGALEHLLDSPDSSNRMAHRDYLSSLRSRRFEGLRSSLSPGTLSPRRGLSQLHSRATSMASVRQLDNLTEDDVQSTDIIKWTKLRKISDQLFSEAGKRSFGQSTCLIVAGYLAIGTSRGLILIYDYHQVCKHIIGNGTAGEPSVIDLILVLILQHYLQALSHRSRSLRTTSSQPADTRTVAFFLGT